MLREKNLNLLPVLLALLEEESVVGAARRVHLSQPAVSGALARLRDEFDDPLLVRVGRRMRRTSRADRLLPQIKHSCAELERVFDFGVFEPTTSQTRFTVAAPDHLAFLITGELLRILSKEAPGVVVHFVEPPIDLPIHLNEGAIDFAVAANFDVWTDVSFEPLIRERFVAAVSIAHPLAERAVVGEDDLASYPGASRTGVVRARRNTERTTTGIPVLDLAARVTLEQYVSAVVLSVGTDNVVVAPEMLVESLAQHLPIRGIPFVADYGVDAGMFWAPFNDDSPEIVWLRDVIRRCLTPFAGADDTSMG